MRTFSRYLLESPIDELPPTIKGEHPHKIQDTYEEAKDSADRDDMWDGRWGHLGFESRHRYHDPDTGIKTDIEMNHNREDEKRKDGKQGVAYIKVTVNDSWGDASKSGHGFQMPGDIMKKISVSHGHLHHFIGQYNPHTIRYDTPDPKRHALYQHIARLYPHIKFENTDKVDPVKRKPKKVLVDSVNLNYWNTANINKFILESPLDELPPTVEGPHPHERVNTYEEEKDSAIRDENWPPQADIGFTSRHMYHDRDSGIKTHIEMDHATPGWTGRQHPRFGVARCEVTANGVFGDSSQTGSRFHMPGEIMGKIASSSSHLHDFITKYNPHTIEYSTTDPKRHALYQHMARHLYPHIWFNNIREVDPVKRKPKKVLADSVNTNYWNTANINKFILESPIDELPAAVEGPHPHKIQDTYEKEKELSSRQNPELGFQSLHVYHDPDNEVNTTILSNHLAPGWTGDLPDSLFPHHMHPELIPSRNAGIAHISTQVAASFDDKSKYKFHMPGEIMAKIKSSASHVHDFITKHTPLGLHTITYRTSDPKRHALYQHIARLYPHITFQNIMTNGMMKPIKREPKKALTDSVNTNYWNMSNINKFILESPIDELPAAVEGTHPHQTENTYEDQKRGAAWKMKQDPHEAPIGFRSDHTYYDPSTRVATQIKMNHLTPGWTGDRHPSTGIATVEVSAGGQWGDSSQNGSNFQMPSDIMGKIKSSREHIHDFITKYKPHTIEYDTSDPKRHMLYQHIARQYPRILFRNTGDVKPVKRKPKKAVAVSESYTKKQMATANKTSRNSGAIGKKAITPAYVKTITSKKHKILDFGSGRDAAHTKVLRKSGRNVTAHEFGANVNQNHDPRALEGKYDTVFASNVLNTSSSRKMLSDTLDQMHSAVAPGGALVANLPLSPRKSVKVDAKHLMRQLLNRFADVRRVGGTKKAPLFHATGPK